MVRTTKLSNTEHRIVSRLVADVLAAGFTVSVWDGEAYALRNSTTKREIMAEMAETDETWLVLRKGDLRGWVRLIHGNEEDVLSDHTTNLDEVLAGVNRYISML